MNTTNKTWSNAMEKKNRDKILTFKNDETLDSMKNILMIKVFFCTFLSFLSALLVVWVLLVVSVPSEVSVPSPFSAFSFCRHLQIRPDQARSVKWKKNQVNQTIRTWTNYPRSCISNYGLAMALKYSYTPLDDTLVI